MSVNTRENSLYKILSNPKGTNYSADVLHIQQYRVPIFCIRLNYKAIKIFDHVTYIYLLFNRF